jgi:hypothetical protein
MESGKIVSWRKERLVQEDVVSFVHGEVVSWFMEKL